MSSLCNICFEEKEDCKHSGSKYRDLVYLISKNITLKNEGAYDEWYLECSFDYLYTFEYLEDCCQMYMGICTMDDYDSPLWVKYIYKTIKNCIKKIKKDLDGGVLFSDRDIKFINKILEDIK